MNRLAEIIAEHDSGGDASEVGLAGHLTSVRSGVWLAGMLLIRPLHYLSPQPSHPLAGAQRLEHQPQAPPPSSHLNYDTPAALGPVLISGGITTAFAPREVSAERSAPGTGSWIER